MATKASISKNLSKEIGLSYKDSQLFLEYFLTTIKDNIQIKDIKITKFGTFYKHKTPNRIGRNPLTKETYKIKSFFKINFKASNNIKKILN